MTSRPVAAPTVPAPRGSLLLRDLDLRDTALLKALAILAIVFHNFFHAVSPAHQNEFSFDPARFPIFLSAVQHPPLAIQAFFSFFGHYGVQIFIFLSAYGLSRSHWDDRAGWPAFMAGRVKKLYPIFALVVVPWMMLVAFRLGPLTFFKTVGLRLLLLLTGVSASAPGYSLPPVGPWWFIPFIVQFYALWPLLRRVTNKLGWPGLVTVAVAGVAITSAINPALAHHSFNLMTTPIGRMPVICMGIAAARFPLRINGLLALAGGVVLVLGSIYAVLWPLSALGALMLALWMYGKACPVLRQIPLLQRLGDYSLLVFLLNGIVRNQFVPMAGSPRSQLVLGCVSAAVSFAIAALIYELVLRQRPAPPQLRPT
ncbi:MAG TPA: acyltransferase [Terracidiphilus sp.]|jgi:peptidoglycan/LPS O-acetylase OafA/YrhL|nr:acyltransferase [Terracidiphilus sp.]